jgi:hypothetical protein
VSRAAAARAVDVSADQAIGLRLVGVALFAVVPAALLFAALAPDSWVASAATGGIACPFREATGVLCPFCNMTHATLALGQGDLVASVGYHPLGFAVLGLWSWGSLQLARRQSSPLLRQSWAPLALGALVAVIWAANLVAWPAS